MIRSLDTVFLDRARTKQTEVQSGPKAGTPTQFPSSVSTVPMTKDLFKKLFLKK